MLLLNEYKISGYNIIILCFNYDRKEYICTLIVNNQVFRTCSEVLKVLVSNFAMSTIVRSQKFQHFAQNKRKTVYYFDKKALSTDPGFKSQLEAILLIQLDVRSGFTEVSFMRNFQGSLFFRLEKGSSLSIALDNKFGSGVFDLQGFGSFGYRMLVNYDQLYQLFSFLRNRLELTQMLILLQDKGFSIDYVYFNYYSSCSYFNLKSQCLYQAIPELKIYLRCVKTLKTNKKTQKILHLLSSENLTPYVPLILASSGVILFDFTHIT